jgi:translation initiation factor 4A
MDGIVIRTLIGGSSVQDDIQALRENPPHLVVGCAGRVYDMIRRRALTAHTVKICVLDEADEMLSSGFNKDPGFKEQIHNIFRILPGDMQIALFSATMPRSVLDLTKKFLRNPVKILMKNNEITLDGIKQYYIAMFSDRDKLDCIKDLFSKISVGQTIIYANSVPRVRELFQTMVQDGFPVCCIHRDMSKAERQNILQEFKDGKYRVLISSDITARGIDVQQVNVVINYDVPYSVDTYLHRIGRSGRWGRKGVAINFVTRRDTRQMKTIENHYEITLEEMPENVVL